MLPARTTGKLCTREEMSGTKQRRDKGCPAPFRLAKICQQRCAKQGICMGLHGKKKRLDVRLHPTEFRFPTPHGGLIRLAGIRRFSIHDVLDDRGLVVIVWKDEKRYSYDGRDALPEELNDNEVARVTHCDDAIIIFVR